MATTLAFDVYGTLIDTSGVALHCKSMWVSGHAHLQAYGVRNNWSTRFVAA